MAKLTLFRADKRVFKPGDKIETAGHFADMHPEPGKLAEALLSTQKPDGIPERTECLMLFVEERRAREFCAIMSDGFLYKVDVEEEDIEHRGDMHLVNAIAKNFMNGIEGNVGLAESYWRGEVTSDPCIEVLVRSGIVSHQVVFSKADREALVRARFDIKTAEPEPYPWEVP